MLTIRLSRTGKKHKPQYRIVVQEKHEDPWAPAKEVVGLYNPHTEPSTIELNEEKIKSWLEKGAQPSNTVNNMLINAGIIKGEKAKAVRITKKRATKMEEKKSAEEEAQKAAEEAKKAEEETKKAEEAAKAAEPVEAPAQEDESSESGDSEEKKEETSANKESKEEKSE